MEVELKQQEAAMDIVIEKVPYEKKLIMRNLMELYNYDFSVYEDEDVNEFGLYDYERLDYYWTEEGRFPYLIKVDSKIAGFALIRMIEGNDSEIERNSIAEFFIMKKYRRKGIGAEVAQRVFRMFEGKWEIFVVGANTPAISFWENIINGYSNGVYAQESNDSGDGIIFTFANK